jgi:hypothetical protein
MVPAAYQHLQTTPALPLNISVDTSKGFSTPKPPKRTIPVAQRHAGIVDATAALLPLYGPSVFYHA